MAFAKAVNVISRFLSAEDIRSGADLEAVLRTAGENTAADTHTDVVVLCASAVLDTADIVLSTLRELKSKEENSAEGGHLVVVLCGGKGHSTVLMHEAVARHPKYGRLTEQTKDLPEARILQAIAEQYYGFTIQNDIPSDVQDLNSSRRGMEVLVEDQSTNCGANASKTRELLEAHGITRPRSIVVSQDPTMCRRTLASFQKVYDDIEPALYGWPTFVPHVEMQEDLPEVENGTLLQFDMDRMVGINDSMLWTMDRFLELIMGEIPRIRDDEEGYGPKGKGFISHVTVPEDVLQAWELLRSVVGSTAR